MGLLRHIRRCNTWNPEDYVPFVVAETQVGLVRRDFLAPLKDHPDAFETTADLVRVAARWTDADSRTQAVDAACRRMGERGLLGHWREEPFAVVEAPGQQPLMLLERAAVSRFGVLGTGVHMNGYVTGTNGLHMWVGKRAVNRPVEPGKFDQIVAGGQPAALTLADNLVKECAEEANIPAYMARQAAPVGALSYCTDVERGLRRDILYLFDLELPADFTPVNQDGETERFDLLPLAEVESVLRAGDAFKFNCALVAIDFLIRHGALPQEDPEYLPLIQGLRTHDGRLT